MKNAWPIVTRRFTAIRNRVCFCGWYSPSVRTTIIYRTAVECLYFRMRYYVDAWYTCQQHFNLGFPQEYAGKLLIKKTFFWVKYLTEPEGKILLRHPKKSIVYCGFFLTNLHVWSLVNTLTPRRQDTQAGTLEIQADMAYKRVGRKAGRKDTQEHKLETKADK